RVYSNQLVELPANRKGMLDEDEGGEQDGADGEAERVYFYSPADAPDMPAAALAAKVFAERGDAVKEGITLRFPIARPAELPDYTWVSALTSVDGLYVVRNFVNSGEALVDENGFFARETQVVQMTLRSMPMPLDEVTIDGPFLVFFASD